jgi:hypothetical protein
MTEFAERNVPKDLELLPELYKQFNHLANIWLVENHPHSEHENGNSKNYHCYLKLYSNAAQGGNSVNFYLGDEIFSYDTIQDALAEINEILKIKMRSLKH